MENAHSEFERELRTLEEKLLDPQVRAIPAAVAALLADDFIEFGRSGRMYDMSQVIKAIAASPIGPVDVLDVCARPLAREVALVTYRTVCRDGGGATLRSSVWRRTPEGWRLIFHQGTPAAEQA